MDMDWVYSPSGRWYYRKEINRLEDDGCPNTWPDVKDTEILTQNVTEHHFPESLPFKRGLTVIYSCGNCGWYVWHPINYCHKCGGRMRRLQGKSADLIIHVRKNAFENGGF